MKRPLKIALLSFLLLVGATGSAPAAHAAVGAACDPDPELDLPCGTGETCGAGNTCVAETPPPTPPAVSSAAKIPTNPTGEVGEALGGVMGWIMKLFAWLVGVAALTLDWATLFGVVHMGTYIKDITAIGVTWQIFRDLGNIVLIFGFIAIGISIILNNERLGYGKKMLPMLLIAAVFMNFSLFISEAVIDTGNLFATQFFKQINGGHIPDPGATTVESEGISNKLMGQLGLQTMYKGFNDEVAKSGNTWLVGFLGIILFLITAFVMFSLAFIIIARLVILILLIISAPIGLAGLAVPKLEGLAHKWWSMLFGQTITAPILFLLLYVALAVITDTGFLTGLCGSGTCTKNSLGFIEGNDYAGFASMLLSFFIAMGLLLAVVMASKSLSAFGASWATKFAGAASFGAVGYGLSAGLGGAARLARWRIQRSGSNSATARVASRWLRRTENFRPDLRRLPGVGATLTAAGAGGAATAIAGSAVSRVGQARQWVGHSGEAEDKLHGQETRVPRLQDAIAGGNTAEITRHLGNMSDKELESGDGLHLLLDPHASAVAAALPQSRYEKLLTSEALSDDQKTRLRNQRDLGLIQRYTTLQNAQGGVGPGHQNYQNPPTHATAPNATAPSAWNPGQLMTRAEQAVRGLTDETVKQLPDAVLQQPQVYEHLTLRQLNAIQNAGKISDATATTIGNFLQTDPTFDSYFYNGNLRQQDELNQFWHTNLPIRQQGQGGNRGGGQNNNAPAAAPAGAPARGPAGYEPNAGGVILVNNNPGGGPRP